MKLPMESLVNGVSSSSETQSSASVTGSSSSSSSSSNPSSTSDTPRPSRLPSPKPSRSEGPCTASELIIRSNGVRVIRHPNGSISYQKHSFETANEIMQCEALPAMAEENCESKIAKTELVARSQPFNYSGLQLLTTEKKSCSSDPLDGCESSYLTGSLGSERMAPGPGQGSTGQLNSHKMDQSELSVFPSCTSSQSAGIQYADAKEFFTNTEASECTSSAEKPAISSEVTNSFGFTETRKTNTYRGSTSSDASDESCFSSFTSAYKPHKANDTRWEAIQAIRSRVGELELKHFRLLRRLGCGDIGSVYLSELCGTKSSFAMKVMDKPALASRKKLLRAQTEREILQCLDHPFLPTLYTHFETEKLSCLVMEFCPGGDLHALRQKQPGKFFPEHAARFYVAEVLLALEYLHMLGIVYRDLKPENVLVREDGHIMLSDFDLSLRCSVSPTLVRSSNLSLVSKNSSYFAKPALMEPACVMQPDCIQPTCFGPRFFSSKPKKEKKKKKGKNKVKNDTAHQVNPLPELIAEPTNARSMSFVGTHEYLAPEIIKGEGHGSAVDWWTFGIFLYELLFGKTPFKGAGNRATLFNVVGQPLKFPDYPAVSFAARDLIRGLLVKEPQHRLAYRRGATEIKQHPFFQSVNWALIRCTSPPEVPKQDINAGTGVKASGNYLEIDFF